ncbi:MAG TPA: alcohol dehydrogenase catalytic domain-containing protein [Candidatus Dormibacteraeota bacterium]|nr:alcohol dehydrogenase catalytic domain-containing protein [Candidatus Dormibacteraeota bacterium]
MTEARAAVQHGSRQVVVERLPVPEPLDDTAVLAVEANGMCGSDWEQYRRGADANDFVTFPLVPGHETVGRIHSIGDVARARWGVDVGDRVAVNSLVSCGICTHCLAGRRLFCRERLIYGYTPTSVAPGLWGGYAQYMALRPNTILYRVAETVSSEDAVLFNPLAGGFDWLCRVGGVGAGDSALIIGAGQRGLSAVVAASVAGASTIILAGRGRHRWKLELAAELGATHVVDMEREDVVDRVREITGGAMVDCALDTTPIALEPVRIAVDSVRPEGVVVFGGLKGGADQVPGLSPDRLCARGISVRGVVGVSDWSKQQAVHTVASGRYPLYRFHTHTVALDEIDRALRIMGGEVEGEEALHVTVKCT